MSCTCAVARLSVKAAQWSEKVAPPNNADLRAKAFYEFRVSRFEASRGQASQWQAAQNDRPPGYVADDDRPRTPRATTRQTRKMPWCHGSIDWLSSNVINHQQHCLQEKASNYGERCWDQPTMSVALSATTCGSAQRRTAKRPSGPSGPREATVDAADVGGLRYWGVPYWGPEAEAERKSDIGVLITRGIPKP